MVMAKASGSPMAMPAPTIRSECFSAMVRISPPSRQCHPYADLMRALRDKE